MIRHIQNESFFNHELQAKVESFNLDASNLTNDRASTEAELAGLRGQAMNGELEGLAGLGKKRDALKAKLLTCLIDSAKLESTRAPMQADVTKAYEVEKAKRETALANRETEIKELFEKNGLESRFLQGVVNGSVAGLRQGVRDVTTAPRLETEQDKANVLEMRLQIAELMQ